MDTGANVHSNQDTTTEVGVDQDIPLEPTDRLTSNGADRSEGLIATLLDPTSSNTAPPGPIWDELRRHSRSVRIDHPTGVGLWSFSGFDECREVLRDHRSMSSEDGVILASVGVGDSAGGSTITLMDPPNHSEIRKIIRRYLTPGEAREAEPRIRANITELLQPGLDAGATDFAEVVEGLSMAAFGEVIGIDRQHWPTVSRAAAASASPHDPYYASGSADDTLRAAHHDLFTVFRACIRKRRTEPGHDIISGLLSQEAASIVPSEWHVLLNCYSTVLGAVSTTPHVATHTLLALSRDQELWERARNDRSLLPGIVEEGVRWASPTKHLVRQVSAGRRLGDSEIAAGEWACAWIGSANRDETVFDRPDHFDPTRTEQHLGFGFGPHLCIGLHFARVALCTLFDILVDSVERIDLDGEARVLQSNWINGFTNCPVAFGTRNGDQP